MKGGTKGGQGSRGWTTTLFLISLSDFKYFRGISKQSETELTSLHISFSSSISTVRYPNYIYQGLRGRVPLPNRTIFWKSSKGGGGHFQSNKTKMG